MRKNNSESRLFNRFSLLTLIAVYVLILVGGIVRSTGSGMGCPDWPKCFGNWVPPTDVSELPDNYKEIYSEKRAKKNVRFAKYLTILGFDETADRILTDESILEEADFNKHKTWIEYINRLLGVLIGLFILGTFVLSIKFLKTDKTIFYVALATLLLVIFQGWIGSIVVSTNLVPWVVTVHMLLALVIVALLVFLVYRITYSWDTQVQFKHRKLFMWILGACMLTLLVQIVLGTQVREAIDHIAAYLNYSNRELWINGIGEIFITHRSFSWVILFLHVVLLVVVGSLKRSMLTVSLILVIILTIISGAVMGYFAIPAAMQPVHLLLGTLAFGLQFLLFLQASRVRGKLKAS